MTRISLRRLSHEDVERIAKTVPFSRTENGIGSCFLIQRYPVVKLLKDGVEQHVYNGYDQSAEKRRRKILDREAS